MTPFLENGIAIRLEAKALRLASRLTGFMP
jgi:hypothetical protein